MNERWIVDDPDTLMWCGRWCKNADSRMPTD